MNGIDFVMSAYQPTIPQVAKADSDDKLRAVTREFEALLLHHVFKAMRRTIPDSPFTNHGERVFRDMLDLEYAMRMAEAGGVGLADILYVSLSPNYGNTETTASALNILVEEK